ncbi:MAG: hypothetical protein CVV64_18255 [Candidatus Wallbacteria bacterium HGW-Wallbacteria-1]|jgi:hypothetical protein|uniref:KAP NTPase domain-containing protein n=1 Tax=Candidatus Wallbacteria bacterium HGW-Wallbacteria-1 TaxID=2013854 RepID=A0A2N1PJN5_9BACT|nr:MAG: hypothetical protein CVV64_18255 [Candidatus Wallbacteria bacterium HGW-Wallbacteria-1]
MLLHKKVIEIDSNDIFSGFFPEREPQVKGLTRLLSADTEPTTICINSAWGNGKTTFLRILNAHLESEGYPTIFLNVWELDYSIDSMSALIGEVCKSIDSSWAEDSTTLSKIKETIKKSAKPFIKNSISTVLKIATYGALDLDKVSEQEIGKALDGIVKDHIDSYEENKKSMDSLKNALQEFADLNYSKTNKPLIFIIDELDRCKPHFSIEFLERVKHLFSLDKIKFVIATDKEQLCHSINSVYGLNFDASGYLKRFFDFEFFLSLPQNCEYFKELISKYKIISVLNKLHKTNNEVSFIISVFTFLVHTYCLTLREQEQCISALNVALKSFDHFFDLDICYMSLLIVIKIKKHELYEKYVKESVSSLEIVNDLAGKVTIANENREIMLFISLKAFQSDNDDISSQSFWSFLNSANYSTSILLNEKEAQDYVNRHTQSRSTNRKMDYIKQVEFLKNFQF